MKVETFIEVTMKMTLDEAKVVRRVLSEDNSLDSAQIWDALDKALREVAQ